SAAARTEIEHRRGAGRLHRTADLRRHRAEDLRGVEHEGEPVGAAVAHCTRAPRQIFQLDELTAPHGCRVDCGVRTNDGITLQPGTPMRADSAGAPFAGPGPWAAVRRATGGRRSGR